MCMLDDSDGIVSIIASGWIAKARAAHKCRECHRDIDAGERYYRERYAFDGELTNHKTCEHCMVARVWLQDECGGWLYGSVEEDIREHAYSGGYPIQVIRLAVGMGWKWRAPSGKLLPVPPVPQTTHERLAAQRGRGE